MRPPKRAVLTAGALIFFWAGPAGPSEAHAQTQDQRIAWAPKPAELPPYVEPHRPLWRLSEILAEHAGQESWSMTVVDDALLKAQYISMPPGERTPTRFYADNRAWWIVQQGQIRFEIEGQEPFIASHGFLVQVPYRVPFSMETVGDEPSLRFEVTVAGASLLYPEDETPEPVEGMEFVRIRVGDQAGSYDEQNRPYLDFQTEIVEGRGRGGAFVQDDRGFANVIRGMAQPLPPETSVGHFHLDYPEFWFILEGEINYLIEGVGLITGEQGDIVYVPPGRYHRATSGGDGMSTRLAINGYPAGLHNWPPPAADNDR
jgi:mannose-6-phosphate isomerase-like protein (cupin superfamily)